MQIIITKISITKIWVIAKEQKFTFLTAFYVIWLHIRVRYMEMLWRSLSPLTQICIELMGKSLSLSLSFFLSLSFSLFLSNSLSLFFLLSLSLFSPFLLKRKRENEREREREREKEREKERERDNMDRIESQVICICIWQCWYSIAGYQVTNKRRFQRHKKRQKHFFSYTAHKSSENLDNQYFYIFTQNLMMRQIFWHPCRFYSPQGSWDMASQNCSRVYGTPCIYILCYASIDVDPKRQQLEMISNSRFT
jgi:hypothetical protein